MPCRCQKVCATTSCSVPACGGGEDDVPRDLGAHSVEPALWGGKIHSQLDSLGFYEAAGADNAVLAHRSIADHYIMLLCFQRNIGIQPL